MPAAVIQNARFQMLSVPSTVVTQAVPLLIMPSVPTDRVILPSEHRDAGVSAGANRVFVDATGWCQPADLDAVFPGILVAKTVTPMN